MMPKRIQLKRTKGWRMPEGAVKVDRTTKWGNPYRFGVAERRGHKNTVLTSARGLVDAFWRYAARCVETNESYFEPLRGRDLACWCKLCAAHKDGKPFGVQCPDCAPCHADVLGEIANEKEKL